MIFPLLSSLSQLFLLGLAWPGLALLPFCHWWLQHSHFSPSVGQKKREGFGNEVQPNRSWLKLVPVSAPHWDRAEFKALPEDFKHLDVLLCADGPLFAAEAPSESIRLGWVGVPC